MRKIKGGVTKYHMGIGRIKKRRRILQSPQALQLQQLAAEQGGTARVTVDIGEINAATQISYVRRWPELFASGTAYTSLRRTLMNLPGGIPSRLLVNLSGIHLQRPIFKRLELMGVLLAAEQQNQTNQRTFQFATENRIRVAMDIVGRSFGRRLSRRSTKDLDWFVGQLADYPDLHRGNIVGLAEKVVRHQRDQTACKVENVIRTYGRDGQVKRPPIELPDAAEIQFLDTPAAICEEGVRMQHCVETLIPDAVAGQAYLFHVEKHGFAATVYVDSLGQVRQAQGPFNEPNRACRWATRALQRWGNSLSTPRAVTEVPVAAATYIDDVELQAVPF